MEEKVILTDEQTEEMIKAVESVNADNDDIKNLKEAKDKPIEELIDDIPQEEKNVSITINPVTGETEGVTTPDKNYGFNNDTDIFDDFSDLKPSTEVDKDFSDSQIKRALNSGNKNSNEENFTIEDLNAIRNLLIKKGEQGTIKYSDLPNILRDKVDKTVENALGRGLVNDRYKMARNMLANAVVEEIQTDIINEKISDVVVDLNTSIQNLVKNEYSDIYLQQHKQEINTFVYKFPELAETKYADVPEKKELLFAISDGYKQAHTLEKMYTRYCQGGKQMKIRKIDLENIHKIIRDFEMKYKNNRLTIRDISSAEDILSRFVNERFQTNVIRGFIIVFCKYTRDMKPENTDEHTFMYYFINNILSLDVPTTDKEDMKWRKEFIDNINHFMAAIDDRINN